MTKNILQQQEVEKPLEERKLLHQSDILPKAIKQEHIDGDILKRGKAADRPNGSSHVKMYFSTDTFVLSVWTGSAWKTVTLA